MKIGSTLFLKTVIILMAVFVLTGLLWFPIIEGRNVGKDLFSIYFKDPFLAYAYLASSPFFAALFQGFKLLGYIEKNKVFSPTAVGSLRNIKISSVLFGILNAFILPYILVLAQNDDAPGLAAISFVIVFASAVIATAAGIFQNLLQKAIDIKSENDLTV